MEQICKNCKWWVLDELYFKRYNAKVGDCHANPPVLDTRSSVLSAVFPKMHEDDFCGGFTLNANKNES